MILQTDFDPLRDTGRTHLQFVHLDELCWRARQRMNRAGGQSESDVHVLAPAVV